MATTTPPRLAASRHSSTYARDAVFAEFQPRDARRGLDQGTFVDREPDQTACRHTELDVGGEVALDQLKESLKPLLSIT